MHPAKKRERKQCAMFLDYMVAPDSRVVEWALHNWLCFARERGWSAEEHKAEGVRARAMLESHWAGASAPGTASSSDMRPGPKEFQQPSCISRRRTAL